MLINGGFHWLDVLGYVACVFLGLVWLFVLVAFVVCCVVSWLPSGFGVVLICMCC